MFYIYLEVFRYIYCLFNIYFTSCSAPVVGKPGKEIAREAEGTWIWEGTKIWGGDKRSPRALPFFYIQVSSLEILSHYLFDFLDIDSLDDGLWA